MTNKLNAWDWDLRVRERNIKAGMISDKDLEKYLSQVQDSEANAEPFGTPQPALDPPADDSQDDDAIDSSADSQEEG